MAATDAAPDKDTIKLWAGRPSAASGRTPGTPVRLNRTGAAPSSGPVKPLSPKAAQAAVKALDLKRKRPLVEEFEYVPPEPPAVSQGPVDKVIELAFNPSRDKIREVTIIDRIQGRLFPQLDMINGMFQYCLEVASFRQDHELYRKLYKRERPISPNPLEEFLYRTAQWQKSVAGKNLERATDIALAETETKSEDNEGLSSGADAWKE